MLLKIITGFFLLLGVFFLIRGLSFVAEIENSKNWPTVQGVIVKSELSAESIAQYGDIKSTEYTISTRSVDSAYIEYHFELNGDVYAGTRISIGNYTSEKKAADLLNKYKVGDNVTVYYNENDISKTTLETNQSISNYIGTFVGAIFILVGIIVYRWFS